MTQQERFEAWATSQGINITDNGFGGYDSQWTEGALAGWEAAQAQAAVEPLGFTEETRVGSEFLDGPVDQAETKVLGVRVQEDTVIIKMKGGKRWGNQLARELCHKLLTDREPGGNPNAFNKWS